MTRTTLKIDSQFVGTPPSHNKLNSVIIHITRTTITAAELIKRAVEAQIRDLAICRHESASIIRQILDQHYVLANNTASNIHPALASFMARSEPKINIRSEVRNAISAFEAGSFTIEVDGAAVSNVDQTITVQPDSRVIFMCRPMSRIA